MDLLQDFSDSEPPADVQPPPRGFGRGRHGDERDRRLLAMHMHACKHKLKRERLEDKVVATLRELRPKCRSLQLKVVPRKRYSRQGRQQHTKHGMQLEVCRAKRHRTTTPEALEIAFGQYIIKQGFTQLLRNRDIALRSEVSTKLVRRINTSVAVAGLRRQLELLGCMVACARNERPEFVLTRLTWDETGERVQLDADCGGAVSSTWQAPCPCQAISVQPVSPYRCRCPLSPPTPAPLPVPSSIASSLSSLRSPTGHGIPAFHRRRVEHGGPALQVRHAASGAPLRRRQSPPLRLAQPPHVQRHQPGCARGG